MICVEERYFRAISRDKMFRLGVKIVGGRSLFRS